MKANVSIFNYNGVPITFDRGNDILINATEMARPFNKRPAKWLELPGTQDFLGSLMDIRALNNQEFSSVRLSDTSNNPFVKTIMGSPSNGGGTWMHEDVALEFARWLSPTFAIWCNDRIKELMKFGVTGSNEAILDIISNPDNAIKLLQALSEERAKSASKDSEISILTSKNYLLENINKDLAPKANYTAEVLLSSNTYTFTQIAKELDYRSCNALTSKLKSLGVIFKMSGVWMFSAKYCEKGYSKSRTHKYTNSDGSIGTNTITVLTEAGRLFVHSLLKSKN